MMRMVDDWKSVATHQSLVIRQKSAKICNFWCSSRSSIHTQACSIEICPMLAGAHYPAHSLSLSFDGAAKVTADFYSERHKSTWVPNYISILQTKLQNNNNKIIVYMLQDNLIFCIYIRVWKNSQLGSTGAAYNDGHWTNAPAVVSVVSNKFLINRKKVLCRP